MGTVSLLNIHFWKDIVASMVQDGHLGPDPFQGGKIHGSDGDAFFLTVQFRNDFAPRIDNLDNIDRKRGQNYQSVLQWIILKPLRSKKITLSSIPWHGRNLTAFLNVAQLVPLRPHMTVFRWPCSVGVPLFRTPN